MRLVSSNRLTPTGHAFAEIGTPPMGNYPTHNGISRKILHDVLYEAAVANGVKIRMGLTVSEIENEGTRVGVKFTDGSEGSYQLIVAADGSNSKVRKLVFGDYKLQYIGSSVWRYAFKRPAELETGYMFMGQKAKVGDAVFGGYQDIADCPPGLVERLRHYFLTYKQGPDRVGHIVEITHVYDHAEAYEAIRRSLEDYAAHRDALITGSGEQGAR